MEGLSWRIVKADDEAGVCALSEAIGTFEDLYILESRSVNRYTVSHLVMKLEQCILEVESEERSRDSEMIGVGPLEALQF